MPRRMPLGIDYNRMVLIIAVLERKARELDRKYERLLERLVKLEPGQPHSCGYKAQLTTTSAPKEITVKIPYDIICD